MDYSFDAKLTRAINEQIKTFTPNGCRVYWAICIDSEGAKSLIAGSQYNQFIYAASLSKVFIGAEVLRQIYENKLSLDQAVPTKLFNIVGDARAVVQGSKNYNYSEGETITIDTLLERMLKYSDNTAANILIDLVTRQSINKNIIEKYKWHGSEVTRKFISRSNEDHEYKKAGMTKVSPLHILECFKLIKNNQLISTYVSEHLQSYMRDNDATFPQSLLIPQFKNYFHKIGSVNTNLWSYGIWSAIKSAVQLRLKNSRWEHDACSFEYNNSSYALAVLTFTKAFHNRTFPFKLFSEGLIKFIGKSF